MSKAYKIYEDLKVCPLCAKELEINPNSGKKSCFSHGDFVFKIFEGKIFVEFKLIDPSI